MMIAQSDSDTSFLFNIFLENKYKIALGFILGLVIASVSVFLTPNKYTSSVLLAPVDNSSINSMASQMTSFGGLGSLIGLNDVPTSKTNLAIEILKSRAFTSEFIKNRDVLVPLFAAKKWDIEKKKLVIDDSIYNLETNTWIREAKGPFSSEPTMQEAHRVWIKDHLKISKDSQTQFVEISITHVSPKLAQEWLLAMVQDINEKIRQKDINQSERAIEYLNTKLQENSSEELKSLIYSLIEQQTKIIMLAYTNEYYALEIIDPPIVPDKKSSPFRIITMLIGALMGGIFSYIICIFFNLFKDKSLRISK